MPANTRSLITNQLLHSVGQTPLHHPSSVLPSDRVCQHPPRTATQPDSFKFLISAAQLETTVWIRISSASFTSSVMKSMRTEPLCRRWSQFEHRVVSGRTSPFMRRIGFSAKPRCDGHMRGHLLQRTNLPTINPRYQVQQQTP